MLAEAAYYRFVFWQGMTVPPEGKLVTQHTMLEAAYRTERGLQLHAQPFAAHKKQLTHPSDYAATQELGSKMRQSGIAAFEYISARDPEGGVNVALFTPNALPSNEPASRESWLCELTGTHVKFSAGRNRMIHGYEVDRFLTDGALTQPA